MSEITKLRARLKNVQRNITEYRMTITEAKALLVEIDEISRPAAPKEKPHEVVVNEPTIITRITDGGTFA